MEVFQKKMLFREEIGLSPNAGYRFGNKLKFAVFEQSFGRHKEIEMLRLNVFGFSYDVLILGYSARLCF
jgi:hypothetical protein